MNGASPGHPFRIASGEEAEAMAALINKAFSVEAWFVDGDRIAPDAIRALIATPGAVFLLASDGRGLAGCVLVERRTAQRGYIGLLAVDDSRQRAGLASALMAEGERRLADEGCQAIDITVVNLRYELFPFYERRGYRSGGTLPFPREAKLPCHLVTMTKVVGQVTGGRV